MAIIYIVTSGEYSDYHILGTFSTKEIAEDFIALLGEPEYSERRIEEFELDFSEADYKGKKVFLVRMAKNGDTKEVVTTDSWHNSDFFDMNGHFGRYVIARDAQHAVKIANERRIQLIAMDRWEGK
jgi:hypothetical protein